MYSTQSSPISSLYHASQSIVSCAFSKDFTPRYLSRCPGSMSIWNLKPADRCSPSASNMLYPLYTSMLFISYASIPTPGRIVTEPTLDELTVYGEQPPSESTVVRPGVFHSLIDGWEFPGSKDIPPGAVDDQLTGNRFHYQRVKETQTLSTSSSDRSSIGTKSSSSVATPKTLESL